MGESVTFIDANRPVLLLIDAHPDVLHSLKRLLSLEPFELHSATCAADALGILATQPIDLVMSAARLPDMDGASLLAHIHQHHPHTVRILLTGETDLTLIVKAINEGQDLPLPEQALER